jgi:predicted nucleic acid-binding protein
VKSTLIDAGPLIALFDRNDRFHAAVAGFLEGYKGRLITTWPVITETTHMLDFNVRVQLDFLRWIKRGAIHLFSLDRAHIGRFIALMETYADVPMDLADASLMVAAEQSAVNDILTIDSDFTVYRTAGGGFLSNLLAPHLQPR